MNIINLSGLELKTFTEQDAEDYCQLNNINPDDIKEFNLYNNKLTDISGIKLFKNLISLNLSYNQIKDIFVIKDLINLTELYMHNNQIENISVIQYLNNLKDLSITNLELESDQIQYINSLKKLNFLMCYNGFKDKSVINKLNKNIKQY